MLRVTGQELRTALPAIKRKKLTKCTRKLNMYHPYIKYSMRRHHLLVKEKGTVQ